MRLSKTILFILLLIGLSVSIRSQYNTAEPERTPEQEATKQTEMLQEELKLSTEQIQRLYEMNLKYARERQKSNTRTDALTRNKNKDADLQKILTKEQYLQLQNKRYNRPTIQDVPSNLTPSIKPINSTTTIPANEYKKGKQL